MINFFYDSLEKYKNSTCLSQHIFNIHPLTNSYFNKISENYIIERSFDNIKCFYFDNKFIDSINFYDLQILFSIFNHLLHFNQNLNIIFYDLYIHKILLLNNLDITTKKNNKLKMISGYESDNESDFENFDNYDKTKYIFIKSNKNYFFDILFKTLKIIFINVNNNLPHNLIQNIYINNITNIFKKKIGYCCDIIKLNKIIDNAQIKSLTIIINLFFYIYKNNREKNIDLSLDQFKYEYYTNIINEKKNSELKLCNEWLHYQDNKNEYNIYIKKCNKLIKKIIICSLLTFDKIIVNGDKINIKKMPDHYIYMSIIYYLDHRELDIKNIIKLLNKINDERSNEKMNEIITIIETLSDSFYNII